MKKILLPLMLSLFSTSVFAMIQNDEQEVSTQEISKADAPKKRMSWREQLPSNLIIHNLPANKKHTFKVTGTIVADSQETPFSVDKIEAVSATTTGIMWVKRTDILNTIQSLRLFKKIYGLEEHQSRITSLSVLSVEYEGNSVSYTVNEKEKIPYVLKYVQPEKQKVQLVSGVNPRYSILKNQLSADHFFFHCQPSLDNYNLRIDFDIMKDDKPVGSSFIEIISQGGAVLFSVSAEDIIFKITDESIIKSFFNTYDRMPSLILKSYVLSCGKISSYGHLFSFSEKKRGPNSQFHSLLNVVNENHISYKY